MNFNSESFNKYWTDLYFQLHYPHQEKITHQVIRTMQLIEKTKSTSISDVAEYFHVSHNTASENVKRIIGKGYLMKRKAQSDERKVVLELTEQGREVLERNTSLDRQKLDDVFNRLSSEEKDLIEAAFKLIQERTNDVFGN